MSQGNLAIAPILLQECPYKGLRPYTEEDAEFFFGREAEQEIITTNLTSNRLTLLYGMSGVGKSSVLSAGVAYHLRRQSRKNFEQWGTPELAVTVFNSWQEDPRVGLLKAVEESVSRAWGGRKFAPLPGSQPLDELLNAWIQRLQGELFIILDQFEEYFVYHPQSYPIGEGERNFASEFPLVFNRLRLPVNFLISIREETLAKLDRFKLVIPGLFKNLLRIENLGREAAQEAIYKPLEVYNRRRPSGIPPAEIEPELVEAVLEQVRTGQVQLGDAAGQAEGKIGVQAIQAGRGGIETPYLQLVMTRLWEEEQQAGSSTLRRATCEQLGGAKNIVRTHLDKVMNDLGEEEKQAAAAMFRFLVTGSGGKFAQSLGDLVELTELPEERLRPVLQKLTDEVVVSSGNEQERTANRILRKTEDTAGRPCYEIFHDVLASPILNWRRHYEEKVRREQRLRQLRRPRKTNRKIFVGRSGEINTFVNEILKPEEEPTFNIIAIKGQGGVGKSTLLERFMSEAAGPEFRGYCLTAKVDEQQTTPSDIMDTLVRQLEKFKPPSTDFARFKEALEQYRTGLQQVEVEKEIPVEVTEVSYSNQLDKLLEDAYQLEFEINHALLVCTNPVDRGNYELQLKNVKERISSLQADKRERYSNQSFVMAAITQSRPIRNESEQRRELLRLLTQAFVAELNLLTGSAVDIKQRPYRVILFFDTFEQSGIIAAPWLLDYFLKEDISGNVVLVFAGRDALESSMPNEPKCWLPYLENETTWRFSLDSFTYKETCDFLKGRGITDQKQIDNIWSVSHGLPTYLSFLTTEAKGEVDLTRSAVDNFLKWIPEEEKLKRQLAQEAALLSRPFNREEMAAFPYLSENEQDDYFEWLSRLSFVKGNALDGRYRYHDMARQLFSRHLYQSNRDKCYAARRSLAKYYRRQLEKMEKEQGKEFVGSNEWLELKLALAQQLFLLPDEVSHIEAVEQVIWAYNKAENEQKGEIARVLRELAEDGISNQATVGVRQIAAQLVKLVEAETDDEEILGVLNFLIRRIGDNASASERLRAEIYRIRGIRNTNAKRFEQALSDFNYALELDPKSAQSYSGRGEIYGLLKEYEKALMDLNRAIELDPEYAWTYNMRGNIYHDKLKEYELALRDYTKASELEPTDVVYINNIGNVYRSLKMYEKALAEFEKALELNPKYAWAYVQRSIIYLEQKEYEKALVDLNKALELDSKYALAYVRRGIVYREQKEYSKALAEFEKALELDPKYAWAYSQRGRLSHDILKEYELALEDFTKAQELEPKEAAYFCDISVAYLSIKEYEKALSNLDKALELNPNYSWAYVQRGITYRKQKEYDKALMDLNQALTLNPNYAWVYAQRGITYRQQEAYDKALAEFEKALELNPAYAWAYIQRGITYRNLKQYEKALAEFEKALELDPKYAWAYSQRGRTYLWLKELERSKAEYTRALELEPQLVWYGLILEWIDWIQAKPEKEIAERLEAIAANHSNEHNAYICEGIALWINGQAEEGLVEIERAINMVPDDYDTYFWKGMILATMAGREEEAKEAMELAVANDLPPILLGPLRWLEEDSPQFYEKYGWNLLVKVGLEVRTR